jgi:hypothetical protein
MQDTLVREHVFGYAGYGQQSWDVHAHGKSNHTQANGMMLRSASSGTVSNCARLGQIQACQYVSNSVRFEKTQIMVRYGVHDMQ